MTTSPEINLKIRSVDCQTLATWLEEPEDTMIPAGNEPFSVLILDVRPQNKYFSARILRALNAPPIRLGVVWRTKPDGSWDFSALESSIKLAGGRRAPQLRTSILELATRAENICLYDQKGDDFSVNTMLYPVARMLELSGVDKNNIFFLKGGIANFIGRFTHFVLYLDTSTLAAASPISIFASLKEADRNLVLSMCPVGPSIEEKQLPCIIENVFLGSERHAKNKDLLKKYKIKAVLNCAAEVPNFHFKSKAFKYLKLPMQDHDRYDIGEYASSAIDFLNQHVSQNHNVFVHCHAGRSRSAAVVLEFVMTKKKCTLREAFLLAKKHRNIYPNRGFLGYLLHREHVIIGKSNNVPSIDNTLIDLAWNDGFMSTIIDKGLEALIKECTFTFDSRETTDNIKSYKTIKDKHTDTLKGKVKNTIKNQIQETNTPKPVILDPRSDPKTRTWTPGMFTAFQPVKPVTIKLNEKPPISLGLSTSKKTTKSPPPVKILDYSTLNEGRKTLTMGTLKDGSHGSIDKGRNYKVQDSFTQMGQTLSTALKDLNLSQKQKSKPRNREPHEKVTETINTDDIISKISSKPLPSGVSVQLHLTKPPSKLTKKK